jgi:hypothetical protein
VLPQDRSHASSCFAFEAGFTSDSELLLLAVRRQRDLAGVNWVEFSAGERTELMAWPDDPVPIEALRTHLLAHTEALAAGAPGQGATVARVAEPWQQGDGLPELVAASCRQLGLVVRA